MQRPDIISLPTSQIAAFCTVLGLPSEVQLSTGSMILALEEADFSGIKYVKPEAGVPRMPGAVGFKPQKVSPAIVVKRKAALGRT